MNEKTGLKLPLPLLLLDIVGTLLVALGLYGMIAGDNPFTPYALVLIIIGALLMLPLIVFFVTRLGKSG